MWKRKQITEEKEECNLTLDAKNKNFQCYVDSGCSKYMIGDLDKFINLEIKEKGKFTFGDDPYANILGRGIVSLGNNKAKEKNVLLVENLKHNIPNLS